MSRVFPIRGDNGWEFCESCSNCNSEICDFCDEGDEYESDGYEDKTGAKKELDFSC